MRVKLMDELVKAVYESLTERRSVRDFSDAQIREKELELIIECAHAAPSAGGLRSREFVVVSNTNKISEICDYIFPEKKRSDPRYFKRAQILIIMVAKVEECRISYKRGQLYSIIETSLAGQNMMTMAHALGIGSCWIGQVKERAIADMLEIPSCKKIVGTIAFGRIN